ncbi:hypothetical protein IE077_001538 [Cardiosporidium cionae]|uniref:GYF domain-containing protein n=1 Tax=Cardiosporidium cionae TaxID=476202 RepID=A0ABQ7JDS8_9APIC|nr:hypothetical protein IE077_001538 [Cardiosporidium cionae]|eukprot:KAF8821800.1 hypothetical protein IE077_001538 [Cardiosporidium cionae]
MQGTSGIMDSITQSSICGDTVSGSNVVSSSSTCNTPLWYCQLSDSNEDQIGGPFSIEQLKAYYSSGFIDGLTYVWKEGMTDWRILSDVEHLKMHFTTLEDEETENFDETHLKHNTADSVCLNSPLKTIKNSESSAILPNVKRYPLDQIPEKFQYRSEDDIDYIFDSVDAQWRTKEAYLSLLETEGPMALPTPSIFPTKLLEEALFIKKI